MEWLVCQLHPGSVSPDNAYTLKRRLPESISALVCGLIRLLYVGLLVFVCLFWFAGLIILIVSLADADCWPTEVYCLMYRFWKKMLCFWFPVLYSPRGHRHFERLWMLFLALLS